MKRIIYSFIIGSILLLNACQTQSTPIQKTPSAIATSTDQPTPTTYSLNASASPPDAGEVSPSTGTYEDGDRVTISAEPYQGYALDHWSGDVSATTRKITIDIHSDTNVTAHFVRTPTLLQFDVGTRWYSPNHAGNILMDFDSDGDLDLILNQFDWPPPQDHRPVLAFRNDGSGVFTEATQEVFAGYPVVTYNGYHYAIEDFNGDGLEDLFIADAGQDHPPYENGPPNGGQSRMLIQNNAGQLIDETTQRLPQKRAWTHNVAAGDIDRDGDVDLYLCNIWGPDVGPEFYINDGTGFFSEDSSRIPSVIANRQRVYTASLLIDIDHDEDLDLILGEASLPSTYDSILLNDGAGTFVFAPEGVLPPRLGGGETHSTLDINSADFNKDGWPDLVMLTHQDYKDGYIQLLINNGDGTFKDESSWIDQDWSKVSAPDCFGEARDYPNEFIWSFIDDFNADGWPDILLEEGSHGFHALLENVEGQGFIVTENMSDYKMEDDYNCPWALVPGELNGDGMVDVVLLYALWRDPTQQVLIRVLDSGINPEDVLIIQLDTPKEADLPEVDIPASLPGNEVIPIEDLARHFPWLPGIDGEFPMTYYYGFNMIMPPFDGVLVRQAFASAVDHQEVVELAESIGFENSRPTMTLTPPEILGRDLYGQVGFPFDPLRAQGLLAEAGYPNGEGFPEVTLVVRTSSMDPDAHKRIADLIVSMWEKNLGVSVEVEVIEDYSEFMQLLSYKPPDIYQFTRGIGFNDPDYVLYELCYSESPVNFGHFSDERFDNLVTQAGLIMDPASRQWLYIQAEQVLTEERTGLIPVFHYTYYSGE